jgi:NTE family protein
MKNIILILVLSFRITDFFGQAYKDSIQYQNLVFEGVGLKGLAYCGALLEMDERGMMKSIKRVAGTSSGAITATFLALGFTPMEISKIIGSTNFAKFSDGGGWWIGGAFRMFRRYGLYKGKAITKWMEKLIESKGLSPDITFEELEEMAKKDSKYKTLVITATCVVHQNAEFFSVHSFPKMRIVDAVRASMTMPLYYEPIAMDNEGHVHDIRHRNDDDHLYLDGGFLTNYPIKVFDDSSLYDCKPFHTIGFKMDGEWHVQHDRQKKGPVKFTINNVIGLGNAGYCIYKEAIYRAYLNQFDWKRTVSIADCEVGAFVKKLSDRQKAELIESGRNGFKKYLFQGY